MQTEPKAKKRGLSHEQIPVLIARDRSGTTLDAILANVDASTVTHVLSAVIKPDAILCSDGNPVYGVYSRVTGVAHRVLNPKHGDASSRQGVPYSERQCLPQSLERLDVPVPRRCDKIPCTLSWLAKIN